ncbi:hypothetical protein KIW84_076642 [Lathyrus oleraceus]|uniref:Uncharacterized protein n=1 Tax=Pisum sativum TaxID=3888 RepID=A0A9D4VX29_PEA|nr:hypothetical protein KIW84_076642 [Pisum sativum]
MVEWFIQIHNPKAMRVSSSQIVVQDVEKDVKALDVDEDLTSSDEDEDVEYEIDSVANNMFVLGNAMTKFNGMNYADWSEKIRFQLGVMDLDMALIMDEKPAAITEDSTEDERSLFEAWERPNMLSLNLMRTTMTENVKPFIPNIENAREFMKNVKE